MPTDQEPTIRTNYTTTATRTDDFERLHDRAVADSPMSTRCGRACPRPHRPRPRHFARTSLLTSPAFRLRGRV